MCTLEQLNNIFLGQYYNIVELDSIVLDVIKEKLSHFSKYLLKHLSFSNASSMWSLAFCTVLFIVVICLPILEVQ